MIKFLCPLKVNSETLKLNILTINWHGNKSWRIYQNFEGERWIWEDERKYGKHKWEIGIKNWKHEIKYCEFKDLKENEIMDNLHKQQF